MCEEISLEKGVCRATSFISNQSEGFPRWACYPVAARSMGDSGISLHAQSPWGKGHKAFPWDSSQGTEETEENKQWTSRCRNGTKSNQWNSTASTWVRSLQDRGPINEKLQKAQTRPIWINLTIGPYSELKVTQGCSPAPYSISSPSLSTGPLGHRGASQANCICSEKTNNRP